MSLLELPLQTEATIQTIIAKHELQNRLHAIGILPQRTITKIQETGQSGPVIVCTAQHCTFALGHDLAATIHVTIKK